MSLKNEDSVCCHLISDVNTENDIELLGAVGGVCDDNSMIQHGMTMEDDTQNDVLLGKKTQSDSSMSMIRDVTLLSESSDTYTTAVNDTNVPLYRSEYAYHAPVVTASDIRAIRKEMHTLSNKQDVILHSVYDNKRCIEKAEKSMLAGKRLFKQNMVGLYVFGAVLVSFVIAYMVMSSQG